MSDKHILLNAIDEDDASLGFDNDENTEQQNESKEDISDVQYVNIDEFLRKGGECGRYQILVLLLISLTMLPSVYPIMIFYYIGYDPPWKCKQPNMTMSVNNNTFQCNSSRLYEHDDKSRCNLDRSEWMYDFNKETLLTEFDLVCNRNWLDALTGSIVFIGWGIGIIVTGYLSDRYGRKKIMFPCLVLTLVFLFLHAIVKSMWQLLLVRLLTGFFFSSPALNHFVMLVEIIGPSRRTLAQMAIAFLWPVGGLVLTLKSMYINDWRTLVILCSAPYLVLQICFLWIPESVRWLNLKRRTKEAEEILHKAARMNRKSLPLIKLKPAETERKHGKKASYIDLFKRWKLVKVMLPQTFIWFTTGMTYYALNWAFADIGGDMYLNFMLSFVVELPGNLLALYLMEKVGRRKASILSYICTALGCIAVACVPKTAGWKVLRVVFGLTAKFTISMAFGIIYMWCSEVYATVLRSQGMGINIVTSRAGAATSPFIKILDQLHPSAPFVLMAICTVIASLLCFLLPETLNKPTRETLDDMLHDGRKASVEMNAVFSLHDNEVVFQPKSNISKTNTNNSEPITRIEAEEEISDENDPLIIS